MAALQDVRLDRIALPGQCRVHSGVGGGGMSGMILALSNADAQNYYIPPIIFAMSIDETTGEEKRTSIDGKQRCTSILRFIDGEVPYIAPDKTKYYYRLGEGVPRTAKELPPALKTRFDMISLVIVEYDDISDDVQRDIFRELL